ncbi:glycoside hydrolase family 3 protein [Cadophora sp. DSE1049]|nr:glycoside hydrolase family 3 protein [Cadophora sp. DSE1049]
MWFSAAQKVLWTWLSSPAGVSNSNISCPDAVSTPPYYSSSSGFIPACQTNPLCSQKVCDTSLSIKERVASLVDSFTLEEKISNLVSSSAGSPRLGLPSYEWWNEALHGVGSSPGVHFPPSGNFSYATSFGSPILTAASFDDALIRDVARVIGKEARTFTNYGFAGFDFWTPNINPFRDPRWGRGQETPGEDSFHVQRYVQNFIPGLQGEDMERKQVIATCKHYAAYDVETGRHGNNYNPSPQDLADYFLAPFKTCVRDVQVGSVMCSYNSVNGIPACANEYLLEEVLRKHWNFTADYNYVVSDCGAVDDIYRYHNFTDSLADAAAVSINAGTDLDCGDSYLKLSYALSVNHTTEETVDRALKRLYSALFSVGYFDGSEYSSLSFSDVATPEAKKLAYSAAVEGITLLKNDGTLPISRAKKYSKVAMIGPFANATEQMQGNYFGKAKHITSPLEAFQNEWNVSYAFGTPISGTNISGFAQALSAARDSEIICYLGGIDNTVESEEFDRTSVAWPGNQLDLIMDLSKLGKPLIVVQFGGGQVDDSPLLENKNVSALLWAGYPGQEGGNALLDIIKGDASVAGRLPVTQYPASYVDEVSIFDIRLRPNASDSFPGRTYKWYTGEPVIPFGYGLHYTEFEFSWESTLQKSYEIKDITSQNCSDTTPFANTTAVVRNTGSCGSDYVGLLFLSSSNAGQAPRPIKSLISYDRLHDIPVGGEKVLRLPLTLGSLARADENGDLTIFPGDYVVALDVDEKIKLEFALTGKKAVVDRLPPVGKKYHFTVPVHIEPPSSIAHS